MVTKRESEFDIYESDQCYAVFAWQPYAKGGGGSAALCFFTGESRNPLEHVIWDAPRKPSEQEVSERVGRWRPDAKLPRGCGSVGEIPWAGLMQTSRKHRAQESNLPSFHPPNPYDIHRLIELGEFAGYRTSRDLRGHSQQLRAAKEYVEALLVGNRPIEAVSNAENLAPAQTRSLIERSRHNGYLTRPRGIEQVTGKAVKVANQINKVIQTLGKEDV